MTAATKTKRTTAAPQTFPPPSGCAEYEKASWLAGLPDLPWLAELRTRHVTLAQEWAAAVDRIADARDAYTAEEARYRAAVRDAVAVGDEAPPRPSSLDPTVRDARVQVALEDAAECRDNLNEHVLAVLAAMRENRDELTAESLPTSLLVALSSGAANARQVTAERVKRLTVPGAIEEVSDTVLVHVGEEPV